MENDYWEIYLNIHKGHSKCDDGRLKVNDGYFNCYGRYWEQDEGR